jgi:hypothetical protein
LGHGGGIRMRGGGRCISLAAPGETNLRPGTE